MPSGGGGGGGGGELALVVGTTIFWDVTTI
jgi:hypothetical protein